MLLDISLKKPQATSVSKKRKANDTTATVVGGRIGTRTKHFLAYISKVIDVLDRHNMKGLNVPAIGKGNDGWHKIFFAIPKFSHAHFQYMAIKLV